MITKYGLNTFLFCAGFSTLIILASLFIQNGWIRYPMIAFSVLFLLFALNFFRDPERISPNRNDVVVSPADGKIVIIKDVFEDEFLKADAKQISIFMSPLNVHVNRIPIDGNVDYFKYVKGEYLVAFHEKADKRNERTEIGITGKDGKVLFTQVAGFIARRIVCDLKTGDQVKMGNRFGMIKFGSRSDVIVPANWKLKVKLGDIVTAGETILFEIEK
ncbi:MAG: phosphatidylserine decarboxylase family protein [Ignavibacteriae bacterium HGW-Ignavibacteriae-3]|nr:MAG: phosphatidylserine decarboxylase family protein [Ignavibacteriae bacterium HGW-Ignavibacteriae-3]